MCALIAQGGWAQQTPKAVLDVDETLFSTVAALNACGYDQELSESLPLRAEVRAAIARNLQVSPEAETARQELCEFYRSHQQPDPSRELAPYVSLALNLGDPPKFEPKQKEADLPPDAKYVLGWVPLLANFYRAAGLYDIWQKQRGDYERLIAAYHEPIANLLLSTDVYLRLPIAGYVGRRFTIYLEPMAAPGQVNSRNYGVDYFMEMSPARNGQLKMEQLRHTYLHFLLDPLMLKRANYLPKFQPVLKLVESAPLEKSFKEDVSMLITESLIRAVEARLIPGKNAEPERVKAVNQDMSEGYVLTQYFYDQLVKFEQQPTGLQDAFPDWLYYFDYARERKRIEAVQFAAGAAPEIVSASNTGARLLQQAERKLSEGDFSEARRLAEEALQQQVDDPGRALFIAAQAATQTSPPDVEGARNYFERTVQTARNPHLVAWSHIYLGRILDMSDRRDEAVEQYRAALLAGDKAADTKAAAERGLKQPFQKPASKPE